MIKHIFFDLDDTLLDFGRAEAEAIRRTFTALGIVPSDDNVKLYSRINRSCWKRLETGEFTRDEVLHRRFDILFETLGTNGDAHSTQRIYEHELSLGAYFLDGAEALLNALYGNYRLYLATNGIITVQSRRISALGLEKYFEHIFVSERIGYNKPDKRFFDECFSAIDGFCRGEAVIIGDSLSSDIQGGINAGIRTVYYNPRQTKNETDTIPTLEVHSLEEIPEILKGM